MTIQCTETRIIFIFTFLLGRKSPKIVPLTLLCVGSETLQRILTFFNVLTYFNKKWYDVHEPLIQSLFI